MELVIALFGGAAGGMLISGISPKISISLWVSIAGGVAGGALVFLAYTKILTNSLAATYSVDLISLVGLVSLGFAGGVLALGGIFLIRWRAAR